VTSIKKQGFRGLLFSFVFALFAVAANAQYASFDLPFEAHWGKAVLEPGHYRIAAPMSTVWPQVLYLMGPNKVHTVIASTQQPNPAVEHSFIKVVNYGSDHYITDFAWGDRGKYFTFPKPKMREQLMTKGRKPEVSVVPIGSSN
jgi:hypothetical protein